MPFASCHICLNQYSIEKFRFFPCGHGCCVSCVENILNVERPICHSCRAPIRREVVKPIFLDFVEPRIALATTVIDGLDRMGASSKSINVTKTRDMIEKTAENIEAEKEVARTLQKSIDDFSARIIPLFVKVESQAAELDSLKKNLLKYRQNKDELVEQATQPFLEGIRQLRRELRTMKLTADNTTAELAKSSAEVLRCRKRAAVAEKAAAEAERESDSLCETLRRRSVVERAQLQKIKKLKQQVADLTSYVKAGQAPQASPRTTTSQDHDGGADMAHAFSPATHRNSLAESSHRGFGKLLRSGFEKITQKRSARNSGDYTTTADALERPNQDQSYSGYVVRLREDVYVHVF